MITAASELIGNIAEDFKEVEQEKREGEFPIHTFPAFIQKYILEINEKLNFPVDYIGASVLLAACVSVGMTHKARVKNGWEESLAIFLLLIGPPGINKSNPLAKAIEDIQKRDGLFFKDFIDKTKDYEKLKASKPKEKEKEEYELPEPPIRKQSIIGDTTGEAMLCVLRDNPKGCGLIQDEGAGIFKALNRYNAGNEEETLLSIFNNKAISINRKGGGSLYIENPFLAIGGTSQPEVIKEIFSKSNRNESGLSDRFIYAWPSNVSRPYFNEKELDYNVLLDYSTVIKRLFLLDFKQTEFGPAPHILQFDADAKRAFIEWSNRNTDLINQTDNNRFKSIYSKLEIYTIRLSLAMQLISWGCHESEKEAIELKSVQAAIELAEYFRITAHKMAGLISSNSSPYQALTQLQIKVIEALPETFETNEGVAIVGNIKVNGKEMAVRTFKEFLHRKDLFEKLDHGLYQKIKINA